MSLLMDAAILTQTEEMLDANTGTGPLAATLAETCPPPVRKANRRAARKQAAPRDQAAAPKAPDEPLVEVAMVPTPVVEDAAVAQVEAAAADAIVEPAAQPPACPEATQVGSPAAAAASPPSGPHVPVWAKLDLVARMQALRSARSAQIARLRGFAEDNGFKAAGIFVAVGAGWIIGANSFDDSAQTRRLTETMQAFASKLEQVEQTGLLTQGQEIGALRREIAALGSRLENVQSGTTKAAAQLSGRLDRFEHAGTDSRALEQLSQRLDTLERRTGDAAALTQAQLQPAAPRDPHALPLPPETTRVAMQPARIPADGYVLRRVRDGAAVVESRAGLREIVPGDNLPGAGRVRAIEKRAGEWVVVTSGGVIDAKAY